MDHDTDVLFTVDQIAACNTALRAALGKPPEHVTTADFVAMISDEIEQLRAIGWDDGVIAALVHESTGSVIDAGSIAAFYATPAQRGKPPA